MYEGSAHRYTFFLTLTYSNDYVPKISFQKNYDNQLIDLHNTLTRNTNDFDRLPSLYATRTDNSNLSALHLLSRKQQISTTYNYYNTQNLNFEGNNTILYANKKDLQKYIKRVRYHIYKKTGEFIRYYAVSEYGPKTFRPHFHVLFYFDKSETLSIFRKVTINNWKYGDCYSELQKSNCSSYVSGYLNSFLSLPNILKTKHLAPFCTHSKLFGVAALSHYKPYFYENSTNAFNGNSIQLLSNLVSLYSSSTIERCYFPKVYRQSQLTTTDVQQLYGIYIKAVKIDGLLGSPSDMMPYINDNEFQHEFNLLQLSKGWENVPTLVSRVYNAFLVSKHFYTFVCESNMNLFHIRYQQINDYYKHKSLLSLERFYLSQEEYSNSTDNPDFSLFYPESYDFEIWKEYIKLTPIYKETSLYISNITSQNIKHKELNDANGILISNINKQTKL